MVKFIDLKKKLSLWETKKITKKIKQKKILLNMSVLLKEN